MTIKRDSIILGPTLKPVSLAGTYDWFALEYTPLPTRGATTSSGLDAVPRIAIRAKPAGPFTNEAGVEVGSVVEQPFVELMLSNPDGDDTIPLRLDVIRGTGRFHRRATEMRPGFNVVAPRELYRPGSKGQNVVSGAGTTHICDAGLNPRGLLIQGGSLTAQGDGAADGGAFLYADNGGVSTFIAGLACDKSAGAIVIPVPTIEIPPGLSLFLILTSTKDRGIVNGIVL